MLLKSPLQISSGAPFNPDAKQKPWRSYELGPLDPFYQNSCFVIFPDERVNQKENGLSSLEEISEDTPLSVPQNGQLSASPIRLSRLVRI